MKDAYDEHHRATLEQVTLEALVDDPAGGVNVELGEDVIEQENVRLRVNGTRQSNTSLGV